MPIRSKISLHLYKLQETKRLNKTDSYFINKRAQRALGRSPKEKVKGHRGAIYRGPLMLSTKYW